jgi:hypothetical protein
MRTTRVANYKPVLLEITAAGDGLTLKRFDERDVFLDILYTDVSPLLSAAPKGAGV